MVVVPENSGVWQKNDLLISGWNGATGYFGQGNNITVLRNGVPINTLTISPNSIADKNCTAVGIGFTMAMAYVGAGKVITCSVPIPKPSQAMPNVTAVPGCCFVVNSNGSVLATFRGNGINAAWYAKALPSPRQTGHMT